MRKGNMVLAFYCVMQSTLSICFLALGHPPPIGEVAAVVNIAFSIYFYIYHQTRNREGLIMRDDAYCSFDPG